MIIRKALSFLALFGILTSIATASQAATEEPDQRLYETIQEVIDLLHTDNAALSAEQKRNQILHLLESRFSFDIIIRRALGRNWNQLSESQQERVTEIISDLLIQAYTRELENGPKPAVSLVKTDDLGSNKIEVFTNVTYKSNLVSINYRLANIKGRGWQVYDVLVEGVSMVSNYRKQFDEHFQKGSADELLKILEDKLKE